MFVRLTKITVKFCKIWMSSFFVNISNVIVEKASGIKILCCRGSGDDLFFYVFEMLSRGQNWAIPQRKIELFLASVFC